MKKLLLSISFLLLFVSLGFGQLILSGVVDASLSGGKPKFIELYVLADIPDLGIYGIGSANNGGGSNGVEFYLEGSATEGDFIYVASEDSVFNVFMGFFPTFNGGNAANINGDDAVELFKNDIVIDVFGEIDNDGTGTNWEYMDGWAYRNNSVPVNGGNFDENDWYYSGINALDNAQTNATASIPFPVGTYSPSGGQTVLANDDYASVDENSSVEIYILSNDIYSGNDYSIEIASSPTEGVAVVQEGYILYTPNPDICNSTDSFAYTLCENDVCSTASVYIEITCPTEYPEYPISVVTTNNSETGIADSIGVSCSLTGIVATPNFISGGDTKQFFIVDDANNGIAIYGQVPEFDVVVGDLVTINGTISQYNGLTQIIPDEIIVVSSDNDLPSPNIISDVMVENDESSILRVNSVQIMGHAEAGGGVNYELANDLLGTYTMRIDNDLPAAELPLSDGDILNFVIGLGGQFDTSEPYTEGYQILPRYTSDIEVANKVIDLDFLSNIKIGPNPVVEKAMISGLTKIDELLITSVDGEIVKSFYSINGSQEIDMTSEPSGVYILMFIKDGSIANRKLIKL